MIFTIELTILDDTSNTKKIIEFTQTISLSEFYNEKYKLVLDEIIVHIYGYNIIIGQLIQQIVMYQ